MVVRSPTVVVVLVDLTAGGGMVVRSPTVVATGSPTMIEGDEGPPGAVDMGVNVSSNETRS